MSSLFDSLQNKHGCDDRIEVLTLEEVASAVASRMDRGLPAIGNRRSARSRLETMIKNELEIASVHAQCVAGVDEAGRGPLAGPVVAAAVVLPISSPNRLVEALVGIDDSKRLPKRRREELFLAVTEVSDAVSIGIATSGEIDLFNILGATHLAMRRAIDRLAKRPDLALVDGNTDPHASCPSRCVVGGDRRVLSISAASIVAKVVRDTIMECIHESFPDYGFDTNKGYPTRQHYRALAANGPCPVHRRSFRLAPRG